MTVTPICADRPAFDIEELAENLDTIARSSLKLGVLVDVVESMTHELARVAGALQPEPPRIVQVLPVEAPLPGTFEGEAATVVGWAVTDQPGVLWPVVNDRTGRPRIIDEVAEGHEWTPYP